MNSFLANLIEHFKSNCAWLFMPALLVIIALIIAGSILHDKVSPESFSAGLLGLGIVGLAFMWRAVRIARRRSRYESSPLSRDELNKARSKLVNRNKI